MHESCKIILQVGIPISRRKRLGLYFRFLRLAVKSLSESRDRVRSITSRLAILQRPKLTDGRTDLAVRLNRLQTKLLTSRLGGCDYVKPCAPSQCAHERSSRHTLHLISGALCILLPFRVPFRVPAFRLSQLPGKWSFKFID